MIIYPVIPEKIVVHLGAPSAPAQNVSVGFAEYIKNVASSELYPTWNEQALRANIYAQLSVALNRVYTEYYRSAGRDFDITSSPAFDQTFIFGREIFGNIARIVDEIFNSYLKRPRYVEPLFAAFCDGIKVTCNGLSQWGSVDLADRGRDAFSILQYYYGQNLDLITDVEVENIRESAPAIPLREGDAGYDVEWVQIKLNRISTNFPSIPKIYPPDGFFDTGTKEAVIAFQEVFSLTPDGLVGPATWYRIQNVYNGVKQLASLNSEGIRLSDFPSNFAGRTLQEGMASSEVLTLQYYLDYIAQFVASVSGCVIDGAFGPQTRASVISFQNTYAVEPTGVVDQITWNRIQGIYYSLIQTIDFGFVPGEALPYPGRVLREGLTGADVRVLQEYLNYIGRFYPTLPTITVDGVFGPRTKAAVSAFKTFFDLPGEKTRVYTQDWRAIATIYQDLYDGSQVAEGQFPGYTIS